jgi:hypothetical protein
MKNFKLWHDLCHTHTHTFKFLIMFLFFAFSSNWVSGQNQTGALTLVSAGINNATNVARCTLRWASIPNNSIPTTARGYNISLQFNNATTLSVRPQPATAISPAFFTTSPSNVTVSCNQVALSRFSSSAFTLPIAPYNSLVIVSFSCEPGTTCSVNATGTLINSTGQFLPITPPTSPLSFTFAGTSISGTITKPPVAGVQICTNGGVISNGLLIPGVSVEKTIPFPLNCPTGQTPQTILSPDGNFTFSNNVPSTEYTFIPSKTATSTAVCCGITGNDPFLLNRFVLGLATLNLAQVMAADFSGNGIATTFDATQMNLCIQGTTPSFGSTWRPWRFVPYPAFGVNDPTIDPLGFTIPANLNGVPNSKNILSFGGGTSISGASFWGVKRGDIDSDCQLCGSNIIGTPEERDQVQPKEVQILLPDAPLKSGMEMLIPIRVENIADLFVMGMNLVFDGSKFEVIGAEKGDLPAESDDRQIGNIAQEGKNIVFRYAWFSLSAEGNAMNENTTLCTIRVRAKSDMDNIQKFIRIDKDDKANYVFFASDDGVENKKQFYLKSPEKTEAAFDISIIGSNQVTNELSLYIHDIRQEQASIIIVDAKGQVLFNQKDNLNAGDTYIALKDLHLPTGMYSVVVQTTTQNKQLRFFSL